MPSNKTAPMRNRKAAPAPILVPTFYPGTKNCGPSVVPPVVLNPKRRYTASLFVNTPYNGAISNGLVAEAIVTGIKTNIATALDASFPAYTGPWKNMRLVSASFWGPPQTSAVPIPFNVSIPTGNFAPHLPPTPARVDESTGSNDRPFVRVNFPPTYWIASSAFPNPPSSVFANVKGVQLAHVTVDLW